MDSKPNIMNKQAQGKSRRCFTSMLKSYRCLILAALVFLIMNGANLPGDRAQAARNAERVSSAAPNVQPPHATASDPAPKFVAYSAYNPDPCYNADSHDAADLCAQWRAALAAEASSHEARRSTTWSIIAAALSLMTVGGLIFSLSQTHGALREARRGNRLAVHSERRSRREAGERARETEQALITATRNADTADKQVVISEMMARRELRAYVLLERSWVEIDKDGIATIILHFVNGGNTPAVNMEIFGALEVVFSGTPPPENAGVSDFSGQESKFSISPKCGRDKPMRLPSLQYTRDIQTGVVDLYVWGEARYEDVFGIRHWSKFLLFAGGVYGLPEGHGLRVSARGNEEDAYQ